MSEQNSIRNMADLKAETTRLRRSIQVKEEELTGDISEVFHSITPLNIISGITSKLIASVPAIYAGYTIYKSIFGRKKK